MATKLYFAATSTAPAPTTGADEFAPLGVSPAQFNQNMANLRAGIDLLVGYAPNQATEDALFTEGYRFVIRTDLITTPTTTTTTAAGATTTTAAGTTTTTAAPAVPGTFTGTDGTAPSASRFTTSLTGSFNASSSVAIKSNQLLFHLAAISGAAYASIATLGDPFIVGMDLSFRFNTAITGSDILTLYVGTSDLSSTVALSVTTSGIANAAGTGVLSGIAAQGLSGIEPVAGDVLHVRFPAVGSVAFYQNATLLGTVQNFTAGSLSGGVKAQITFTTSSTVFVDTYIDDFITA